MKAPAIRLLAVSALAAVVVACGGHGGGDDGPERSGAAALQSRDDLLRELGVLDSATDFVASSSPDEAESPPPVDLAGTVSALLISLGLLPTAAESPQADSTQTRNCSGGGVTVEQKGNTTHGFAFYDAHAASVNFDRLTASACVESNTVEDVTTSSRTDGVTESGHTLSGKDSPAYAYASAGDNGHPLDLQTQQSRGSGPVLASNHRTLLGTQESRVASDSTDARIRLAVSYDGSDEDGQRYAGSFSFGDTGAPFAIHRVPSTGRLDLSGAYAHASVACEGGAARVSTLTAIAGARDGEGYYTTGGVLKLEAGDSGVTVTFNADGSADYAFAGGATGHLSRAELQQQWDTHPCD